MTDRIDWPTLLALGLGQLRLTPAQFWRLTPVELMLMAGMDLTAAPRMSRARLLALAAQYPDKTRGE